MIGNALGRARRLIKARLLAECTGLILGQKRVPPGVVVLASRVGIGTASPQGRTNIAETGTAVALNVSNTGSGNSFVVEDSSGDTSPFVIDNAGNVGIGTSTISSSTRLNISGGDLAVGNLVSCNTIDTTANGTFVCGTDAGISDISVFVNNSANQNIPSAETTVLTFNTESYDTDTMHSTVSNTGRLTATTAGKYHIGSVVTIFNDGTGGFVDFDIRLNGGPVIARQTYRMVEASNDYIGVQIHTDYNMAANDYVEVTAYQGSGGTKRTNVGSGTPQFFMSRFAS